MEIIIYRLGNPITALIDDSDYDLIKGKTLSIDKAGYVKMYLYRDKKVYLHRYLFSLTDIKIEVDHINHNRSDNRRCNLRLCTHKQNTSSKAKGDSKTSKYSGVYYNPWAKRFVACIKVDGKKISLKTYKSEVEAAIAYDIASIKYHRNFGTLNFPGLIDVFNNFILSPENQIRADQYLCEYIPGPEENMEINFE